MTFQVGLLTPVFTQHMGPFNSLFWGSRSNDVKNHAKRLIYCLY